jgi:hypothetical protein
MIIAVLTFNGYIKLAFSLEMRWQQGDAELQLLQIPRHDCQNLT